MGGTAQINAMLRKDGVVVNGDSLHRIIFGERDRRETDRAKALAAAFAARAKASGITTIVFDRSGAPYHGKVKVFADAAREGGLQF